MTEEKLYGKSVTFQSPERVGPVPFKKVRVPSDGKWDEENGVVRNEAGNSIVSIDSYASSEHGRDMVNRRFALQRQAAAEGIIQGVISAGRMPREFRDQEAGAWSAIMERVTAEFFETDNSMAVERLAGFIAKMAKWSEPKETREEKTSDDAPDGVAGELLVILKSVLRDKGVIIDADRVE